MYLNRIDIVASTTCRQAPKAGYYAIQAILCLPARILIMQQLDDGEHPKVRNMSREAVICVHMLPRVD